MAAYRNVKNEEVAIDSTRTAECPTSRLTPDIQWLHGQFHSNAIAVKAGGSLYGPDSRYWPNWWANAVEVCTAATREANNAIGINE